MRTYKSPLTIRGDSLYCPLSLGLDSYWNCEYDCTYCYCRGLNHTWGLNQRAADPEEVERRLVNGLKNPHPKSSLAWALKGKKTIRFGNKSDPFVPLERKLGVTKAILRILKKMEWSLKLETRSTDYLNPAYLEEMDPKLCVITASITCGMDRDYQAFESSDLPTPEERLHALQVIAKEGFQVGVVSEPFMNGWHALQDWETFIQALKDHGIRRVNTYHMHLSPFVAKRLAEIPDLDIEAIWMGNEDRRWKPILRQILEINRREGMIFGCPDFVNSGDYQSSCNTCCGVDVPCPTTFNFIGWKKIGLRCGCVRWEDAEATWDGVGDRKAGREIFDGIQRGFYGWRDLGWTKDDHGWKPGGEKRGFFE